MAGLPRKYTHRTFLASTVLGLMIALVLYLCNPMDLRNHLPAAEETDPPQDPIDLAEFIKAWTEQPGTSHSTGWSRFAYSMYISKSAYVCNSVMMAEALHRLNSSADRLLLHPSNIPVVPAWGQAAYDSALLQKARDEYGATLKAVDILKKKNATEWTRGDSYTKLLNFKQTQYDRILHLDSDGTLLQHMDELFLENSAPIAAPHQYWTSNKGLSAQVLLIKPYEAAFDLLMDATYTAGPSEYDTDIINKVFGGSATILPPRKYAMITGELRRSKGDDHSDFLGNTVEEWDANRVMKDLKYVHFSDWPLAKPWQNQKPDMWIKKMPRCEPYDKHANDLYCRARDIWVELYWDFAQRRKAICGLEMVPSNTVPSYE